MKGVNGRLLRVDLTTGRHRVEEPTEAYYRTYLGGRGVIIHTLLNEVPRDADPLGAENKLIFSLGLLTGHPLPGSGRNSVGAVSPLTGAFGESEAGGFWGAALKRAGYDAVIIEGTAPRPVYLWIDGGEVLLRDAGDLWGSTVPDTDARLREMLGAGVRTAVIGPGGERLVAYACIANDVIHMAGRTGMGAVMGAKRLKAVAVRGSRAPETADRAKVKELASRMARQFKERTAMWRYGTGGTMEKYEENGNLPVRNFRGGLFPGVDKITPRHMFEKGYIEGMDSCYGCPVRCKRRVAGGTVPNVGPVHGGPEYETLGAFGSNCGVDDLDAIIEANELCCRYGIDTISTGGSIAFAMECFEEGILTMEDTAGMPLTFGNAAAMVRMVEAIGERRGLGDILAEGTRRAAHKIGRGASRYAMQVKGVEIPMHEPRCKPGMSLHYGVHAGGADHNTGIHDDRVDVEELAGAHGSPPASGWAEVLHDAGLWKQLTNSLGLCIFVPWTREEVREAVEAVTGLPLSDRQLLDAAERGVALSRIFNLRAGLTASDDALPERFMEAAGEGPLADRALDPACYREARNRYFAVMGWDGDGVPGRERLAELGIVWAAE